MIREVSWMFLCYPRNNTKDSRNKIFVHDSVRFRGCFYAIHEMTLKIHERKIFVHDS